jgi:hypothetical protein
VSAIVMGRIREGFMRDSMLIHSVI